MSWQSTISVGGAIYSVASTLVDVSVWVRADGGELVIVHAEAPDGPREVARHQLTTPGRPSIRDEHYPPRPPGALQRRPKAGPAPYVPLERGISRWSRTTSTLHVLEVDGLSETSAMASQSRPDRRAQAGLDRPPGRQQQGLGSSRFSLSVRSAKHESGRCHEL